MAWKATRVHHQEKLDIVIGMAKVSNYQYLHIAECVEHSDSGLLPSWTPLYIAMFCAYFLTLNCALFYITSLSSCSFGLALHPVCMLALNAPGRTT